MRWASQASWWCAAKESNLQPTDQETITAASTKRLSRSVLWKLASICAESERASAGIREHPKERKAGPLVPFGMDGAATALLARSRSRGCDADPDVHCDDAGGYSVSTPWSRYLRASRGPRGTGTGQGPHPWPPRRGAPDELAGRGSAQKDLSGVAFTHLSNSVVGGHDEAAQ